jgi:hypothetical protein
MPVGSSDTSSLLKVEPKAWATAIRACSMPVAASAGGPTTSPAA